MTPNLLNIQPLPFANDIDGTPLDLGYVYIGQPGLDPQVNPLSVFWDSAALFPAPQPLRTVMGRIYNNGAPAPLYITGDYSLRVLNKNGSQVSLVPNVNVLGGSSGADLVGYLQSGTGAVKYSVQDRLRQFRLAADFNVKGDGSDETAKIQAALNSFPVQGGILALKGTVSGDFRASTLNVPDGVEIWGDGRLATSLRSTTLGGTFITMGLTSALRQMSVGSVSPKTSGYLIDIQKNGTTLESIICHSYFIGVRVGTLGGAQPVGPRILHTNFFNPTVATGGGGILAENYSTLIIDDLIMSGPAFPAVQPDSGIRLLNGDTCVIHAANVTLHGCALKIDPPGGYGNFAFMTSDSCYDSAGAITGGGTKSCVELTPGGSVHNIKFANVWMGLASVQNGCLVTGDVDGLSYAGCEWPDNGGSGLLVSGTQPKNWSVSGGGSGGNGDSGIRAAAATSFFSITGHIAGTWSNRGANDKGIRVDAAASSDYTIAGNTVRGNTTAGIEDFGTGVHAQVTNNNGYNGEVNALGIVVGASPFAYTAGHTPEVIYFAGGTITSISVDGAIVQNATGASVYLAPNESMSVVYTVLPTLIKKQL